MLNTRAEETTQSVGTGALLLDGAPAGRIRLVEAVGSGKAGYFTVETQDGAQWEDFWGVVTAGAPDTVTRNVIRSSNGDAPVDFGAGTKRVYCNPNGDAVRFGAVGEIPVAGGTATHLTVSYAPPLKHLRNGMRFHLITSAACPGAADLTVNGFPVYPIVNMHDGGATIADQWRSSQLLELVYFNGFFVLVAPAAKAVFDDAIIGGKSLLSGASGTSMVFLGKQTAANSASLIFTDIPAAYNHYILSFNHLRPVTGGGYVAAQLSRDNGTTYVSTTNHYWQLSNVKSNNTTSTTAGAADNAWGLAESVSNASGGGLCGELKLYGLGDSVGFKGGTINSEYYDGTNFRRSSGGVWLNDNGNAVNALRIYSGVGNLADGTVALYAVRHS